MSSIPNWASFVVEQVVIHNTSWTSLWGRWTDWSRYVEAYNPIGVEYLPLKSIPTSLEGKSSVTVALFRIVEIEAGRILLDDVDLGQLGLSDVRGRPHGMTIIPQDPFLTGSTLRECLDPFGEKSDADLFDALYSVRLVAKEDSTEVLNTVVEEGGSNYSVGERQLLNLAAALLYRPKVLVLDEATASIDPETDAFVQKLLRSRFAGSTIITIAHRLNTIMDYDSVLVMDSGHAAEFGSPADLLMTNGPFSALVDATGQEGRKALRAMVGAP